MTTGHRLRAPPPPRARLEPFTLARRDLRPDDVEVRITHCGVCHTDLHARRGHAGRGDAPLVPGHEFVGEVAAVGAGRRPRSRWATRSRSATSSTRAAECAMCRAGPGEHVRRLPDPHLRRRRPHRRDADARRRGPRRTSCATGLRLPPPRPPRPRRGGAPDVRRASRCGSRCGSGAPARARGSASSASAGSATSRSSSRVALGAEVTVFTTHGRQGRRRTCARARTDVVVSTDDDGDGGSRRQPGPPPRLRPGRRTTSGPTSRTLALDGTLVVARLPRGGDGRRDGPAARPHEPGLVVGQRRAGPDRRRCSTSAASTA